MAYRKTSLAPAMIAMIGALVAAPLAADVKRGVDAWSSGDFETAVNEWRQPATQGNPDALFNLGQAYRLGRGVTADIGRARELYAEAAQKGHVKAADNYGLLLFQQGEQKEAMPLIQAAADRGDPRAQYVLGLAHFNADYAKKDWVRAYALLTLAQGSGLPQASGALKQMDEYIPIAQRQEAQVLARGIEAEASKRRAAQLAAADLRQRQPGPVPATAPVATPAPVSFPAPARVAAAPAPSPTRASAPMPSMAAAPAAPIASRAIAPKPAPSAARSPVPSPAPMSAQPVRVAQVAQTTQAAPVGKAGNWGVQLGAFGVAANADRLWSKLSGNPALAGTQKTLVPGGRVTRLRAVGYATRAEASRACDALSRQGQACMVSKPSA
ncbi:MAG: SPOR domain-containing protein [Pseudomonadota bacterium]